MRFLILTRSNHKKEAPATLLGLCLQIRKKADEKNEKTKRKRREIQDIKFSNSKAISLSARELFAKRIKNSFLMTNDELLIRETIWNFRNSNRRRFTDRVPVSKVSFKLQTIFHTWSAHLSSFYHATTRDSKDRKRGSCAGGKFE